MSNYPLAQKQYRSNIDCHPSQGVDCSMSRPISDTEDTNGCRPFTSDPSAVNEDLSPSSGNNEHAIQNYSTLAHHPPSLHPWSYQRPAPAADRFPSSSCQSQSYNNYHSSVNLPPLNQIPESRKQYPEPISSNELPPEEPGEDTSGLPSCLKKFMLDGSKSSGPPHALNHNSNAMLIRHQVDSRSQSSVDQSSMTYYPSDRRKTGRSTRCGRDQILEQPYFVDMIKQALNGNELKDITPAQIKTLVKRYPISPEHIRKWEDYAEYKPDATDPKNEYVCIICGYTAKKQLMTRHILGKHLGIKFFGCPFCDGSYHQMMSAICHVTTHLKVFPYKCNYCDQYFNDMARRHRHYQEQHDYKAKETKRTPKSKKSQKKSQEKEPSDST